MATSCAENKTPISDGVSHPVSPQLAAVVKRAKAAAAQIWVLLHSRSCTEGNACRMAGCVRTRRLYAIARAAQAPNGPRLSAVESGAVAEARKLLLHFAQCRSVRLSAARRAATRKSNNEEEAAAVPRPTCLVCSLVARARPTEARDGAPGGLDFTSSPYDPSLPTPSLHVSTHVYHTRHGGRRRGNSVDATVSSSTTADAPNRRSSSGISGVLAGKHNGKRVRSGSCSSGLGIKSQQELTWAPSVYSPVKSRSRLGGRDWKQTAPPSQDLFPRAHEGSGSRNSSCSSRYARVVGRSRAQSVSSAYGNESATSEVPLSTAAARLLGLARYQAPESNENNSSNGGDQKGNPLTSAASNEELREGADLLHFLGRRSADDNEAMNSHSEAPLAKRPRAMSWACGSSSSAAARPLAFGFENGVGAAAANTHEPISATTICSSSGMTPMEEDLFGNANLSPGRVAGKPSVMTSLSMPSSSIEEHSGDVGMRKGSACSWGSDDACTAPLRSGDAAPQSTPRQGSARASCPATPPAASAAAASAGGGGPLVQSITLETSPSSSSSTAPSAWSSAGSSSSTSSTSSGCDVVLAPLLVALDRHVLCGSAADNASGTTADGAVNGDLPTLRPPPWPLKSPRSPGSDAVLSLLRLAGAAAHSPKGVIAASPMDKAAVAQESS